MHLVLLPFIALAALGLLLSIAATAFAVLNLPIPGGKWVWALHIGIFVVWLPAVIVAKRAVRGAAQTDFWKIVLSGCPQWVRYALYGLFGYAFINFISFVTSGSMRPQSTDSATPWIVRGFSGHWMIFYGAALAIMCSAYRMPRLLHRQTCLNGHRVSAIDVFCPTCGTPLPVPDQRNN